MTDRLDRAIAKLEARHDGIPMDERIIENRDYSNLVMVIKTLKSFKAQMAKMDELLTKLGV